jgi:hypothetical protein
MPKNPGKLGARLEVGKKGFWIVLRGSTGLSMSRSLIGLNIF